MPLSFLALAVCSLLLLASSVLPSAAAVPLRHGSFSPASVVARPSSSTVASGAARALACLNACSGRGLCSPASTCLCDAGWLGVDCSVASLMAPLCVPSSASPPPLCMYWRVVGSVYYHRVLAVTVPSPSNPANASNPGWAAVLWDNDASQGPMTGGKIALVSAPSPYAPLVQDYYAATEDTPALTADQTVPSYNVTGTSTASTLDVSFQRACDTGKPQHFVVPTAPGSTTTLGVAWLGGPLAYHDTNAHTFAPLDLVAAQAQSACVANCSGRGLCVGTGDAAACSCSQGFLGSDCAIASAMAPRCFHDGDLCAYWRIVGASLFVRVLAKSNPKATTSAPAAGYGALMWGAAADGMSNGTGHVVAWNATAGRARVFDIYATRKGSVQTARAQIAVDVTGWASNTSLDVSFQRPLLSFDAQHFNLSAEPGVTVPLSVSVGEVSAPMQRHVWAQYSAIDMAEAATGAQCPNDCSGNGFCAVSGVCQCSVGFLGADCAVASLMAPQCWNGGVYCAYWRIVASNLLVRIAAVTNPRQLNGSALGYAAMMWGAASDGMTNGTGHRVSVNATTGRPLVLDIYALRQGPPLSALQQTATDVAGWATNTSVDVSFTRPLAAVDAQHMSHSANPGFVVPLSVAVGDAVFRQHTWALWTTIDVAHAAAGTRCLNDCSGRGSCTAAVVCKCDVGYLEEDCSVRSFMEPLCFGAAAAGQLCVYWRFSGASLLLRLTAQTTAAGWAGIMWGAAADGMTGGMGHYVSVTAAGIPQVVDVSASRRGRPAVATAQVAGGIAGFATNGSIDVSFTRPIVVADAEHYNLSSLLDVSTPLSVAVGAVTFQKHVWANYSHIDMGAAAAGTGCPNACSGHGLCSPSSTCRCDEHYLALDCSVLAAHSLCPHSPAFCMDWAILDGRLLMRVRAFVQGWAALMWGASADGMTGGRVIQLLLPQQDQPVATEMFSASRQAPTAVAWNGVGDNVTGYSTAEYTDFSFVRPLVLAQNGALQLPTAPGQPVMLSWVAKDGDWGFHGRDADRVGQVSVDMWSGDAAVVASASLLPSYSAVLLAAGLVLVGALLLRVQALADSAVGRCCLRKRPSSFGSDAFALSAAHARERSSLSSDSRALIIQSDDSVTVTSTFKALLAVLDNATLNAASTVWHLTVGELFVLVAYFASMAAFVLSAVTGLAWAVILGHLTAVHLTLAVLPASRNSVWHALFGVSFERAIKWHRFVARATAVLVLLHAACAVWTFGLAVLLSTEPLPEGMGAVYGTLAATCIVLMALTALGSIRRALFEAFYYVHVPLFVSTMLFASLHSVYARYYLAVPIALIGVDWLLRSVHHWRAVDVVDSAVLHSEEEGAWRVARLTVRARMAPTPGQYVFVQFPALSLLQWHPFSVSSLPDQAGRDSTFTVHMLDMGSGSFTASVCDLLTASEYASTTFKVSLDGPYGSLTLSYERYPTLLLVAGGIGITPLASILYSVLASARDVRVFLVWASRHAASFHSLFPDLLTRVLGDPRMSVELFDTAGRSGARAPMHVGVGTEELLRNDSVSEEKDADANGLPTVRGWSGAEHVVGAGGNGARAVEIRRGRPSLARVFEMVAVEHQQREDKLGPKRIDPAMRGASGVAVIACGPTALLDGVEKESMAFGFHLHRETFLL